MLWNRALAPKPVTQLADQRGVLGPAFGEDVAHAVEHGRNVRETAVRIHERGGLDRRHPDRIREQQVGERLDAGLAGDHRLGPALLLERQVEVFEFLLGRRGIDGGAQIGCQLALFGDALEHRRAAFFQFAQVAQAGFEFAQLDVIEVVGRFLAVARDEGNGGAAVEQFDGR